eukprot:6178647-Pleurochrysis_carterae.AAC.2
MARAIARAESALRARRERAPRAPRAGAHAARALMRARRGRAVRAQMAMNGGACARPRDRAQGRTRKTRVARGARAEDHAGVRLRAKICARVGSNVAAVAPPTRADNSAYTACQSFMPPVAAEQSCEETMEATNPLPRRETRVADA